MNDRRRQELHRSIVVLLLSLVINLMWSPARIATPAPKVRQLELVASVTEGLFPAEFEAKCCVDQAAHGEHDCLGELAW